MNNTEQIAPNPDPDEHRGWVPKYDIIAPLVDWGNYIKPVPSPTIQPTAEPTPPGTPMPTEPPGATPSPTPFINLQPEFYDKLTINGGSYEPYLPGFSSQFKLDDDPNTDYQPQNICYSSGTECQGLVSRAAGYNNNPYESNDAQWLPKDNVYSTWKNYYATGIIGCDKWNTGNYGVAVNTMTSHTAVTIVPGDMIQIDGHVGIVYRIDYDQNREAARSKIYIIEAYGGTMTVYNQRTWENFHTGAIFCNLVRLKCK